MSHSASTGPRKAVLRQRRFELAVLVPGRAVPQGSQRAFKRGEKVIVTSDNPRLKDWRSLAVFYLQQSHWKQREFDPWEGPVRVWIEERRLRPKSVKRQRPTVRPDLDKIIRACLDALTVAQVIRDDAQVIEIEAYKCYGPEARTEIRVYSIDDEEID